MKRTFTQKNISMFCFLFFFFVVCGSFLSHAQTLPAFSGGDGTESNPYLLSSNADLNALAAFITNAATSTATAGKYFKLTKNLDYGGGIVTNFTRNWSGICCNIFQRYI